MSYTVPASLIPNRVLQESYMDIISENMRTLGVHDHSGSMGEGAQNLAISSSISGCLPYRVEYMPSIVTVTLVGRDGWVVDHWQDGQAMGATYNRFFTATNGSTPRATIWGFKNSGASNVSACDGVFTKVYIQSGNVRLDLYYQKSPSGGVAQISYNGSTVLTDLDTYAAASSLNLYSGSFATNGSNPIYLAFRISTSKNVSSAGCQLWFGTYCLRWLS